MPWPDTDGTVFRLIKQEIERQNTSIRLIASENFASPAVLAATGSVLTNKYSEGYPGRRYYGGNKIVDEIEDLARQRACALFEADHANVQPHAGAIANMCVYQAFLKPGDTVLGMSLDHGGHLTHGSPVNFSGQYYRFVSYGVTDSDERIDLAQIEELAYEHHPKMIVLGATAYPRTIDTKPVREIADEVGAVLVFDAAHIAGLIAGGAHPNPTELADVVTFTTHKTLRGPRGGAIVCKSEHAKSIDKAMFPGIQGGPLEHVIAAKAVAFEEASSRLFETYAAQIVANSQALVSALADQGFRPVSGGTDNHLILIDLRTFDPDLTGKKAQSVLDNAGIVVNKNTIPNDSRSPFVASGIRIGTAAVTTQGMDADDMTVIADLIVRVLRHQDDEQVAAKVRHEAQELCASRPPYPDLLKTL